MENIRDRGDRDRVNGKLQHPCKQPGKCGIHLYPQHLGGRNRGYPGQAGWLDYRESVSSSKKTLTQ